VVGLYGEIASAVTAASNAFASMQSMLAEAQDTKDKIVASYNDATTKKNTKDKKSNAKIVTKHSGGIVGNPISNSELPEYIMALTDIDLKPNETLAKLLNGEVVLNQNQMKNMLGNLNNAYSSITPLNKRESSPITVSIGDVNVYNPDNTDMIVNEIVRELPLKVVQRLYSK
jgi:hypothetical protein